MVNAATRITAAAQTLMLSISIIIIFFCVALNNNYRCRILVLRFYCKFVVFRPELKQNIYKKNNSWDASQKIKKLIKKKFSIIIFSVETKGAQSNTEYMIDFCFKKIILFVLVRIIRRITYLRHLIPHLAYLGD